MRINELPQPLPAGPSWLHPLVTACGAVAVAVLVLLFVGGAGVQQPPPGVVLDDEDRRALATISIERGAEAPPVDPTVDPADPEAVARAYLAVAHSVTSDDTGRTHLRAAGYAVPGSPAWSVGVIVVDPPPPGTIRTATVTALELVAVDPANSRRGYRAEIGTATGMPGGPVTVAAVDAFIVLARQSDGRWLVAADPTTIPDLPAGEH